MKMMRKIFFMGLVAFVACNLLACSDDDEATPVAPRVEVVELGDYNSADLKTNQSVVTTIKFSSNSNWHIYSDKMWVLFSVAENGPYYNDMKGVAGTHTVYVKITDAGRTFDTSAANVKVACADSEFSLYTFERPAKELTSQMVNFDGETISSVELGNDESVYIKIDANYAFGVKYYPSWMESPEPYDDGYLLKVKEEYIPFALSDKFVIASSDNSVENSFDVNYLGLAPSYMDVSGEHSSYGWEFHTDGKTFRTTASSIEGAAVEPFVYDFISYDIKCFNYDCEFVVLNRGKNASMSIAESPWIIVERDAEDNSKIIVKALPFTPSASERSRTACLFAVPSGMYDDFIADINSETDIDAFIDGHNDYVVIEATQKDIFATEGFSITKNDGTAVECRKLTEGDLFTWVSSELGSDDNPIEVYEMTGEAGVNYVVNTLYTEDEWSDGGFNIYDADGNVPGPRWGRPSRSQNSDGFYVIKFKVPTAGITQPTVLRLHINNVNKKALIIMPANN